MIDLLEFALIDLSRNKANAFLLFDRCSDWGLKWIDADGGTLAFFINCNVCLHVDYVS